MCVVAIIGLLAAMAVPRFSAFQARARQAEARTNLSHMYKLQVTYFAENGSYFHLHPVIVGKPGNAMSPDPALNCLPNALGFTLAACAGAANHIRYGYTVGGGVNMFAWATSGAGAFNKVAPGCATPDVWQITHNNDLQINGANNAATACY